MTVFAVGALLLLAGYAEDFTSLLRGVVGFALGAILFKIMSLSERVIVLIIAAFATCSAVIWASGHSEYIAVDLASAAVVLAALSSKRLAQYAGLNTTPLKFLGKISYSLYMCHAAVIWVFNQALKVLLHRPVIEIAGTSVTQLSSTEAAITYVVVTTCCIMLATAVFFLIEEPCRALSRKKVGKLK